MTLLVNPPVAKPCEPPAGLCCLAGMLMDNSQPYKLLDANLEGMLSLMQTPRGSSETWTHRAEKHCAGHLEKLHHRGFYEKFDSYKRAVSDINRLLTVAGNTSDLRVSLEDYEDKILSPMRSRDLIEAAEKPLRNPFYSYFSRRLEDVIGKERPQHVGFSLTYLSQALCCFAMMGFVKKHFPHLPIILGGGLVTSWAKSPGWKNPFEGLADYIVVGPGEGPLLAILGRESNINLRCKPCYDWETAGSYLAPGFIMPYSTSQGCWWSRCSFCPERAEDNAYIQHPHNRVISELRDLTEKVKPALIHLTDNAVSPALLHRLAHDKPGAPWYGFVRITEDFLDLNFCNSLRDSGCVMLKVGVESGNEGVLESLHKGVNPSIAARALKNISEAGIATYVYLLFGTPYESEKEARDTLNFVIAHNANIDFLNLAVFNLPLLSPDSQDLTLTSFYEGDLTLYADFIHPGGWDRRAIRRFLDSEFKKHPAIKPILLRQPPFFTSNHAPFFTKGFREYR